MLIYTYTYMYVHLYVNYFSLNQGDRGNSLYKYLHIVSNEEMSIDKRKHL